MHAYTYTYIFAHMLAYIFVHTHAHTSIYKTRKSVIIQFSTFISTYTLGITSHTHKLFNTKAFTYRTVHTYLHAHTHMPMHTHVHTYINKIRKVHPITSSQTFNNNQHDKSKSFANDGTGNNN